MQNMQKKKVYALADYITTRYNYFMLAEDENAALQRAQGTPSPDYLDETEEVPRRTELQGEAQSILLCRTHTEGNAEQIRVIPQPVPDHWASSAAFFWGYQVEEERVNSELKFWPRADWREAEPGAWAAALAQPPTDAGLTRAAENPLNLDQPGPARPTSTLCALPGEKATTTVVSLALPQFFQLANKMQQQYALQAILKLVHTAYGEQHGAARVLLNGGEPCYGALKYRHLDQVAVFDHHGEELEPDFTLPFWQQQPNVDELSGEPDDDLIAHLDEYDDPEEGSREFRIASLLEELLHETCGFLGTEEEREFHLDNDEAKALLAFPFPALFREV